MVGTARATQAEQIDSALKQVQNAIGEIQLMNKRMEEHSDNIPPFNEVLAGKHHIDLLNAEYAKLLAMTEQGYQVKVHHNSRAEA